MISGLFYLRELSSEGFSEGFHGVSRRQRLQEVSGGFEEGFKSPKTFKGVVGNFRGF